MISLLASNRSIFKLFDNENTLSGKNIGFGLGNLFKKEVEQPVANATAILEKYNKVVGTTAWHQEKFNKVTANNNMTKYLQSLKGAKASQEGYNASLKATSVASKAAAAGIKALFVVMNMAVMLPCLNNHCFILIVKGGININQLKKSCSLKELNDCEVALLGVKENEHIITKKIIKKYKRKIKSNSLKLKISVLLSDIGIKCKNIKTVD